MRIRPSQALGLAATVLAAVTALSVAKPAQADTPFASFTEFGGTPLDFSYSSSTKLLTAAPVEVTFEFLTTNGLDAADTPITAWLTLTATAVGGPNSITHLGTTTDYQSFEDIGLSINTLANGSGKNLLTLGPNIGTFAGKDRATSPGSLASSSLSDVYSSQYLNFTGSGLESYGLGLTSSTAYTISRGNLTSFLASGTGTFSTATTPTVAPEASTFVSFGVMFMAGALLFMRRRTVSAP